MLNYIENLKHIVSCLELNHEYSPEFILKLNINQQVWLRIIKILEINSGLTVDSDQDYHEWWT